MTVHDVNTSAADQQVATAAPAKAAKYPKTRRIKFGFAEGDGRPDPMSHYFVEGDMAHSHFVAGLSGGFPAGEEAFIRSVRRYADQITDPTLKKRVAGFIGQEAMHGREHRRLNDRLVEMGYPIAWLEPTEKRLERQIRFEDWLPSALPLAATAAAEHFTAVLAERLLSSDELQAIPGDPEVWNLLNWHALEELEHKSVAFDVYRAVGGSERTRIAVMAAILIGIVPLVSLSLGIAIAGDPIARRKPVTVARQTYKLFRGPMFKGLFRELAVYLKPGFHPDDIDTNGLLEQWQRELFGADGVLVDHVK